MSFKSVAMNNMQHTSVTTQVGHLKLSLPCPLVRSKHSGQCAYVCHTSNAALEQHYLDLPYLQMIAAMGITVDFFFIVVMGTLILTRRYKGQWKELAF